MYMKEQTAVSKKIFLSTTLIFAFLLIGNFYFENEYKEKFYPGIYVDGINVGGKTYSEVLSYYKKGADVINKEGIKIIFEVENSELSVSVPVSATGMSPDKVVEYFSLGDWETKVKEAFDYGKNGSFFEKIQKRILLVSKNKTFEFPAVFQSSAIESFYARELKSHFKDTVPAEFVYGKGGVMITEEKYGETVDLKKISEEINKKLNSFDPEPIRIRADKNDSIVTKEKLKLFLPVAKEMAKTLNFNFTYKDYSWKVTGRKFINWLTLDKNERLVLDNKKLETFLSKNIVPVLDDPAQNSRFETEKGVLVEIVPGKSGNVVNVEKTIAKVEEIVLGIKRTFGGKISLLASLSELPESDITIKDGSINVPIETSVSNPKVTKETISEYNIKELVSSVSTNFKGSSADRIHNIEVGVAKLSGFLIAPGEEFSTVTSIGTTTEEEGFVKEFVIKEDKSIKELGGGLCQIATTLFRLALNSGLPITERINHRYVVGYYGPGLDATIYDPHPDLKFINDTGHYLLLQGKVEGNELIFQFFGQKDGREITISEPKLKDEKPAPGTKYLMSNEIPYATMECSETPRKGITAEVDYIVNYKNGKKNEQKFESIYQPWQKICLIGLGSTTSTKK